MTLTADIVAAIIKAEDEAPVLGQLLEPGEAVSFRVAGVQGPQGEKGAKGDRGERGKDGRDGIDGLPGTDGDRGVDGTPGIDGQNGRPGGTGPQGAKGDRGEKGAKGDKGDRGPAGSVISMGRSGGGGGGGAALSDATPLVESGAGGPGTAGAASRGDHVHPADGGGGGVTDHGALTGLGDDDHPQYETSAEAAAKITTHEAAANPHPTYETSAEAQAKVDAHAATPHGGSGLGAPTTLTIASGSINVTGLDYVIVNGEGAADDVLISMTGGVDGQIVYLEQGNATVTLARGDGPPNGFTYLNQERTDDFQLGNYTMLAKAMYSATQGVWLIEGDYVENSIMSGDGATEIIAHNTDGLSFFADTVKAIVIEEAAGAAKFGVFSKADQGATAAQQAASTIADLWTALKAYGWLTTGSTAPSVGGAPTTVDYLVGTASGDLSAEIVVGTSPGGELGGTWASPTVDATHSGSTHAAAQAAAEATAAGALTTHAAAADPHPGYLTPAEGNAAYDALGAAAAAQAASQPLDSDLTAIAALTTTAYGRSLLEAANAAGLRTLGGLVIGTDVAAFAASASQAEMEAGTEAALRAVSPLRVAQAIAALGGGGGATSFASLMKFGSD